ncbi:MAG TPA: MerR family transcriptional regulator [Acidimicrobiales bacterium]|jgi:DNA-binding transcriptional MerR regulator|nr:MerR family transcriptional regulator [Acidimicrobiales bacterium]
MTAKGASKPARVADGNVGDGDDAERAAPVTLRIGEAAERAGVSSRTLRWYEERGLLVPTGYSVGGARRYSEEDVARLVHIRELQSLLGFDLGEIRDVLRGEDDLSGLRSEYRSGPDDARRREILMEATEINKKLRAVVRGKQERLAGMMGELEAKAANYRARLKEMEPPRGAPRS